MLTPKQALLVTGWVVTLTTGSMGLAQAQPTRLTDVKTQALNRYATPAAISASEIQVYGAVPQPNQVRQDYVIFQEYNGQVVGAYYQPYSEFSCFVGERSQQTLDVDVISMQGKKVADAKIPLASFYDLNTASDNDQRILGMCRQQTAPTAQAIN